MENQKNLGGIISNSLKPETHINDIVKKANRRIGLIERCFTRYTTFNKIYVQTQYLVATCDDVESCIKPGKVIWLCLFEGDTFL